MKPYRQLFVLTVLLASTIYTHAETPVTYNHNPTKYYQITAGFSGKGDFRNDFFQNLAFYTTHFEYGYKESAESATGRASAILPATSANYVVTKDEVNLSDSIKSFQSDNLEREIGNAIDNIADLAAILSEETKVEGALTKLSSNVGKIMKYGGTQAVYDEFMSRLKKHRYALTTIKGKSIAESVDPTKIISMGLSGKCQNYEPNYKRLKAYQDLYSDIIKDNVACCDYTAEAYKAKQIGEDTNTALSPSNRSQYVQNCVGDWRYNALRAWRNTKK